MDLKHREDSSLPAHQLRFTLHQGNHSPHHLPSKATLARGELRDTLLDVRLRTLMQMQSLFRWRPAAIVLWTFGGTVRTVRHFELVDGGNGIIWKNSRSACRGFRQVSSSSFARCCREYRYLRALHCRRDFYAPSDFPRASRRHIGGRLWSFHHGQAMDCLADGRDKCASVARTAIRLAFPVLRDCLCIPRESSSPGLTFGGANGWPGTVFGDSRVAGGSAIAHLFVRLLRYTLMKPIRIVSVLAFLFLASSTCFALIAVETVSKERAKDLGVTISAKMVGTNQVGVWLELHPKASCRRLVP